MKQGSPGITYGSEFTIGSLTYIIEFASSEFQLSVDGRRSPTKIHIEPDLRDDFFAYDFYQPVATSVFESREQVSTRHALGVYRAAMRFVEMTIDIQRPYRFQFAANEARKINLYQRVAAKLAGKYGYYLCTEGNNFAFYKYAD